MKLMNIICITECRATESINSKIRLLKAYGAQTLITLGLLMKVTISAKTPAWLQPGLKWSGAHRPRSQDF